MFEIPEWLMFFVMTLAVPGIAQLIKVLAEKFGWELHRRSITFVAFGLALIAAFATIMPSLPAFDDPMEYIGALLSITTSIYGVGLVWYNLILSYLFVYFEFAPDFQIAGNHGGEVS